MNSKFLYLIFILVLGFRLFFAFNLGYHPDAYFELRQIESIKDTAKPLIHDPLSYGGRENVVFPAFYYVLGTLSTFLPINLVAILLPNIFASFIVIIVYLISKQLTKNTDASLFAALISGFIPLFLGATINTISPLSLQIPLIFLLLYCVMRINEMKFVILFMILSFIIPLIHYSAYLAIFGFLVYLGFANIEKFKFKDRSYELSLFFIFISVWIIILITKKAMVAHGARVFWQNIPYLILENYFSNITLPKVIGGIGILNLLVGVYVLQKYLFSQKNKDIYLLTSFALSISVLLFFKLVSLNFGLSFLAIIFTIFFSKFYDLSLEFIKKSHFNSYIKVFILLLVVALAFNSMIPSVAESSSLESIELSTYSALEWARDNTEQNSTILAPLELGHAINYISQRKNVADSQFMLIPLAEQRLLDIDEFYSTDSILHAVEIANFYDIQYVVVDPKRDLPQSNCFEPVYLDGIKIYELICVTRVDRI